MIQAVWALGNIAGDSPEFRDAVLNAKALSFMVNAASNGNSISLLRQIAFAISNLCRGKPAPQFALVKPALPLLAKLFGVGDTEIVQSVCWALSYISQGDNEKERLTAVINTGVIRDVVTLLRSTNEKLVMPALRIIGNIAAGDNEQTAVCTLFNSRILLNSDNAILDSYQIWRVTTSATVVD